MKSVTKGNWKKMEINAVGTREDDDEWETIELSADSGAVVTVGPKDKCEAYPIEETAESKAGRHFYGANGSPIKNYGVRNVTGVTE